MIALYNETRTFDGNILISRLLSMGVRDVEGTPIDDYIDVLHNTQVDLRNRELYLQEILKAYTLSTQSTEFREISRYIDANSEKPLPDIQMEVEKRVNDALSVSAMLGVEDEGVDLFGDAEQIMKEIAESGGNPCIPIPLPIFTARYGDLETGESYIFAAPPKGGKSTLLAAIMRWALRTPNVKVLYLDTELPSKQVISRNLASVTGINEYYFRKGKWINNKEYISETEKILEKFKRFKNRVMHHFVPSKTAEDIVSMAKRWHSRNVKEGEIALIIYDYIKLTGEDNSSSLKEWELIGKKADALKMLSGTLRDTCVVSAVQLNQQGSVSQSQRIKWFSSFVFHLIKKTPQEIGEQGKQFGTHRLVLDVGRHQGENPGDSDVVEIQRDINGRKEREFITNDIFLNIDNFAVKEVGTVKDYYKTIVGSKPTIRKEKSVDNDEVEF